MRDEWLKALKARLPSRAFAIMRRTDILSVTAPELAELPASGWESTLTALDALPKEDPILRLTALFWPLAAQPGTLADWLMRYRFSNQERERVLRLLSHTLPDPSQSDSAVRRYARSLGRPLFESAALLSTALAEAHFGAGSPEAAQQRALYQRLQELVTPSTPLSQKELAVSGKELMASLALTPGPRVGELLERLLERVLDEPTENQPTRLLELAREML